MPCTRCCGLLVVEAAVWDAPASVSCINCGGRWYLPACPPIEPNPKRQWDAEVCTICLERCAIRGKPYCRACQQQDPEVVKKREIRQRWEARR